MERIWAPWRMQYISNSVTESGCIFCNAWAGSDDRERLLLQRSTHSLIMLNRYPYSGGHLMVAPAKHTANMDDLNNEELLDLTQLMRQANNLLRDTIHPDGINIGINLGRAAGAGVDDHMHIHLVPRWNGDTNFMSVVADLRVIPEGLSEAYDRFAKALKSGDYCD